jgi:hypothetical protein
MLKLLHNNRFVGAWLVQSSTYSGATQAIFLILLVAWYIRYFLQKHGFIAQPVPEFQGFEVHKYE